MATTAIVCQPDQSMPAQPFPPGRKVPATIIVLRRLVRRLSAFAWRDELARAEAEKLNTEGMSRASRPVDHVGPERIARHFLWILKT